MIRRPPRSTRTYTLFPYTTLFRSAGAYICGEETALMESLEGKKGQPRYKPPFPANFGLFGKPTTISNTETFASVPAIVRNGAQWFLALGKPNNGGVQISTSPEARTGGEEGMVTGISRCYAYH